MKIQVEDRKSVNIYDHATVECIIMPFNLTPEKLKQRKENSPEIIVNPDIEEIRRRFGNKGKRSTLLIREDECLTPFYAKNVPKTSKAVNQMNQLLFSSQKVRAQ